MTVLVLLLSSFLFQEHKFLPIHAGNVVPVGPFEILIPEGTYYADETNVNWMFPLAGADFIPNCVGMFYSTDAEWDYAVTVQYYDEARFILAPELGPDAWLDHFSKTHLYFNRPVTAETTVEFPPVYSPADNSFFFGVRYKGSDDEGVYAKRIWVTDQGMLVFSLKSKTFAYERESTQIDGIFHSVAIADLKEPEAADTRPIASYLVVLGMNPPSLASNEEPEGFEFPWLSLAVGAAGLLLLFFALRLQKSKRGPIETGQTSDS